jgi:hypothetical protein
MLSLHLSGISGNTADVLHIGISHQINYTEDSDKNQLVAIFALQCYKCRVWDTQGVPCVYTKAMLAKKLPIPFS